METVQPAGGKRKETEQRHEHQQAANADAWVLSAVTVLLSLLWCYSSDSRQSLPGLLLMSYHFSVVWGVWDKDQGQIPGFQGSSSLAWLPGQWFPSGAPGPQRLCSRDWKEQEQTHWSSLDTPWKGLLQKSHGKWIRDTNRDLGTTGRELQHERAPSSHPLHIAPPCPNIHFNPLLNYSVIPHCPPLGVRPHLTAKEPTTELWIGFLYTGRWHQMVSFWLHRWLPMRKKFKPKWGIP